MKTKKNQKAKVIGSFIFMIVTNVNIMNSIQENNPYSYTKYNEPPPVKLSLTPCIYFESILDG